ncbi:prolyl oligopeptidase family serine peptidase [Cellulomonas sp. ATA003]|uniref:alpha/beta hydrolase family protein n=1 Tax=Cellulomonas sp. ATA003 TaxID=3073064 RepID=UPI002872EB30|nr:prolyl oligopeptidase family serine peptidase [Cellulomonas sp. ATA003]WNB84594.1 prolyl oligopeptidase family serine peptidase [Cellulomonas sp. ATA003]
MPFRTAATAAAGAVALAVLGAVMGPGWDPEPVLDVPVVETSDTTIAPGSALADEPPGVAAVGTYDVTRTVVEVDLDGAVVEAQVTAPVGAGDDLPGLVFVHGAGTGRFAQAFRSQAQHLASAGIVTMVPDKRLDTYTTVHRDYPAMAADYARSVDVLRGWPGVDGTRVGVYGESEGCWIVPVMTAEDRTLDFAVLVSAPVVPPRQQAAFAAASYLRNTDVPSGVFRAIPRAVGLGFPGDAFAYADFDVSPYQQRTTQPVLMAYGTGDASMPLVQGVQEVRADLAATGNDALTVRYYAGADHGIRVDGDVLPALHRDIAAWVDGLPATGTAEPWIAGEQPVQAIRADPLPSPRWFGTVDAVLATVVVAAAALVVGTLSLLTGRVLRWRGHGLAAGLAEPLAGLAVGTVLTVGALVGYLVAVARLALDYERNTWVVQGGWLGVRVLGLAAVVAGAVLIQRIRDVRADPDERVVRGGFAGVGLGALAAGSVILLITLAYWGVYQLGI